MTSYEGYKVKIAMRNENTYDGTIIFVDNQLLKLKNGNFLHFFLSSFLELFTHFKVKTNDPKRGILKEIIIKSSDIKDLEVLGKDLSESSQNGPISSSQPQRSISAPNQRPGFVFS